MTPGEILSKLRSLDVKVWADDGDLCCNAPQGALTEEMRAGLSEHKTEILALLGGGGRSKEPALRSLPRGGGLPLSFAQQRLWFIDQLEPGSALYNVPIAFRIRGRLRVGLLEQSFNEIASRHEVLRTTFKMVDGRAVQNISSRLIVSLPIVDLADRPEAEREGDVLRLIQEEARRPFDLARGPLVRGLVVRAAAEDHILLVTLHHIVCDGWSMALLGRELSALYNAFSSGRASPLADLPIQYADFARWQRQWLDGEVLRRQLAYWKERLANLPLLQLPTDRPRPAVQKHRGARQSIVLSEELCKALKLLSHKERASLFMALTAAFNVLLSRYSGQKDIVIGTAVAGRNRVEIEGLIGFFVNALVLRVDLSGDCTFRELLGRVRDAALDAYTYQDLPFERLVEELQPERNPTYSPLFQVMLVFQNEAETRLDLAELDVREIPIGCNTAKFDLSLELVKVPHGLAATMTYDTDLFEHESIAHILGRFRTLLEGIVVDPNRRISELPILSQAERHRIVVDWNETRKPYPKNTCVHELLEAQSERTPDAVAVVFEGQQWTYSQLNTRANQLAHHLRRLGVGPEVVVGLCLERSLDMIVGLLGILKAGGAYLPLDPTLPEHRLAFMIRDTQARLVITQQRFASPLYAGLDEQLAVVCLDSGREAIAKESDENPANIGFPDSLAYVMYTSGSTGIPKGVGVSHSSITRLVKEQEYAEFGESEVFLQYAPLSFDASTFEIWGCLLNGGKLVVSPAAALAPDHLAKVIKTSGVTTLWLTSALFHLIVEQQIESLRGIKQLLAGGDVLSRAHVIRAFNELPGCRLINGYGPTENTTFSCCYRITSVEQMGDSVPIGRAINNSQAYVLDERFNPVPPGIPGELYVGGDGLARGYFNNPELTAEKFIPHPFTNAAGSRLYGTGDRARYLADGNIEFLGRNDNQVKLRGYRIEPGEIENLLARHPAVREALVVARQDGPGEKRLVGYVVGNGPVDVRTLRGFLKERLPEYMIPSAFVLLDSLPLTSSGKVDRQALPSPGPCRPELETAFVAPRTRTEELLAEVWGELLRVKAVGIRDNFFDLGGHSLLATQVISRLRTVFRLDLPLRSLFETPTIAALAESIETLLWAGEKPPSGFELEDREEVKV